ncbi:hypothetical protein [Peribacillus sp. NPDC097895]|uniref:hypothetical protein n=1 Tax=Peribacillus sp. NPDC097895 TaxID=3390619 RepID=UPI003D0794E1
MKVFTLEVAVMEFGSDAMIKQFNGKKESSKKKKGSIDGKYTKQLISEMECYFESVTAEGKGADRIFTCEGEYEEKQAKKDGRKNNGAKTPYEYEINSLVLDYILKNKPKPMSLNQLIVVTGLVDRRFTVSYYNNVVKTNCHDELKEKYNDTFIDDDIVMLDHFVKTELNTLKDNIKSVLRKLADKKIIMHKVEWYGCVIGSENHRPLTDNEFIAVGDLKRDVATKYVISLKDTWKQNDKKVQEYWKEYNKRLQKELGFKYLYEAHGAVVQVADKDIERYFDKLIEKDELVFCYGLSEINIAMMINDFKGLYGEHAVKRAIDRQEHKNNSDHDLIKQHKVLGEYVPMWEKLLTFYDLANVKDNEIIQLQTSNSYTEAIDNGRRILQIEEGQEANKSA